MAFLFFFFFNDTATTEIYTLSLHDALPILLVRPAQSAGSSKFGPGRHEWPHEQDRKSTRLNSSHSSISYADFCLKKKKYTADAVYLLFRYEDKLEQYHGNLGRAAVVLAKEWRTDNFFF